MRERVLRRVQVLEAPVEEAFDFFSRAENLEAITPPLLGFRITTPGPIAMDVGTLIRYRLRLRGVPVSWLTRIEEWDPRREDSSTASSAAPTRSGTTPTASSPTAPTGSGPG